MVNENMSDKGTPSNRCCNIPCCSASKYPSKIPCSKDILNRWIWTISVISSISLIIGILLPTIFNALLEKELYEDTIIIPASDTSTSSASSSNRNLLLNKNQNKVNFLQYKYTDNGGDATSTYSTNSYDIWYSGGDSANVYINFKIYMYNLLNPVETLNGAKPIFIEEGPYVYREHRRRLDVSYLDDQEKIDFYDQIYYVFDDEQTDSRYLDSEDKYTIINPIVQALIYAFSELSNEEKTQTGKISLDTVSLNGDSKKTSSRSQSHYNPFLRTMKIMIAGIKDLWTKMSKEDQNDISEFLEKIKTEYGLSKNYDVLLKYILCSAQPDHKLTPFTSITPKDLYFGYLQDPILLNLKAMMEKLKFDTSHFATSYPGFTANHTSDEDTRRRSGIQEIYSGKGSKENFHNILSYTLYNNASSVYICPDPAPYDDHFNDSAEFPSCPSFQNEWSETEANENGWILPWSPTSLNQNVNDIKGTDGSEFHHMLKEKEDQSLTMYVDEVCRSLDLFYSGEEMTWRGITLLPYEINIKDFDNSTMNPSNDGFYQWGPNGLSNMTVLANMLLFMSKPHFLDSEKSLLDAVDGIQPYREIHDTFLAVEPITGMTFRAFKRLQINTRITSLFNDTNKTSNVESRLPHIEDSTEVQKEKKRAVEKFKKHRYVDGLNLDPVHNLFQYLRLKIENEKQKTGLEESIYSSMSANPKFENLLEFLDKDIETCMMDSQPWNVYNDEIYMPMTWSEESFEMPESITDDFKTSVYTPMNAVDTSKFWIIICSSALLICSIVAAFLKNSLEKRYKKDVINDEISTPNDEEIQLVVDGESSIDVDSEFENEDDLPVTSNLNNNVDEELGEI